MSRVQEVDGGLYSRRIKIVALGIDQSYSGFAITAMAIAGNEAWFHSWLYASSGTGVQRLRDIRFFLNDVDVALNSAYPVTVSTAALEGYAPGAKYGRELAGELGGMVKLWLWDHHGVEAASVPPTSLKKFVTGKGTGVPKNLMLLQTYKKWGVEFHDDNLADSYGLARLVTGRCELAYEKEVFDKLLLR